MDPQIFGTRKSSATRKAQRFFSERRIRTHFVDVADRPLSPRELDRFAQKFGVQALIDRSSRPFEELGLAHAHLPQARWVEKLLDEPRLLRLPLVRWDHRLSVGPAEAEWKQWLAESS